MEPFNVRPEVTGLVSTVLFPEIPTQRIDHTLWDRPMLAFSPVLGQIGTPVNGMSVGTPAQGLFNESSARPAYRVTLPREQRLSSYSLRDVGLKPGLRVAELLGVPAGLYVLVNHRLYTTTDKSGVVYVQPGHITLATRSGAVLSRGYVQVGHSYEVQDLALWKDMELFLMEGPKDKGPFQFELSRVSQAPGEYITVSRLKRSSYVHVDGQWVQADETGTAKIGPLQSGTYTVLVTDYQGTQYAHFASAVPGDTLYGGFNFSSGYGYYGWYSGKGVEVKRAFIEVLDEFLFQEPSPRMAKTVFATDYFSSTERNQGNKSPARMLEAFLFSDLPALNPVKQTVHEFITAADRAWKHLTPLGTDQFTVNEQASFYNTRVTVYDWITVTDRSNRPASWTVLDILRIDDLPTAARTKQTVYDFVSITDTGKTTYRHFRKADQVYAEMFGSKKNLSKWAKDLIWLEDYKVQTLLTIIGEDWIALTDTAKKQLGSIRVWDGLYLYEQQLVQNTHFMSSDVLQAIDRAVSHTPFKSLLRDPMQLSEGGILGVQAGQLPTGKPDMLFQIRQWARQVQDTVHVVEEVLPELEPPESELNQLTERVMMQRSTRRMDALYLKERGILQRSIFAQDSFMLTDRHLFQHAAQFSPDKLGLTKLASFQYRPELRMTKRLSGAMVAVYLREGGGLYMAQANPDGQWNGVIAKLIANTPVTGARSPSAAEYKGALYTAYAYSDSTRTYFTVLREGAVYWQHTVNTPGQDIQLVSTERYRGDLGELLIGYTEGPRQLTVRNTSSGLPGITQVHTYPNDVRLDQVVLANGSVTWVLAVTDQPGRRNIFSTHPIQGEAVRDARIVNIRPQGIRPISATIRVGWSDQLQVKPGPGKLSTELSRHFEAIQDRFSVQSSSTGIRLTRAYAPITVQEYLATDWKPRQLRLTSALARSNPQDSVQLNVHISQLRLQPAVIRAQPEDDLTVKLKLQGGHYERIK